ncbi:uncharacterized protein LOC126183689 [Schistocerca cancellata]|uniref:uncharacterized protein LOC126183689 n=1 Tax=Schistocerca cancellata TaxID=274614 RepID=UPI002118D72C|nr:uncharacterized protein LOC126183689 [Schistocerca cancellata]
MMPLTKILYHTREILLLSQAFILALPYCTRSFQPHLTLLCNDVMFQFLDKLPSTTEEWKRCSEEFDITSNFPLCVRDDDAPIKTGSECYNYKNFFSIVLFALVDANYHFLYADVVSQGGISDGGIFKNSKLWKKLQDDSLNMP